MILRHIITHFTGWYLFRRCEVEGFYSVLYSWMIESGKTHDEICDLLGEDNANRFRQIVDNWKNEVMR